MSIGEHTVMLVPVAGGDPLDLSCFVDSVKIAHGRDDTTSQPDAATATLEVSYDTALAETLPGAVEIGATLHITTTVAATEVTRFVGPISDISMGWDEAGPDTPDRVIGQVIAASRFADLGRRVVGAEPFPQELDGARVARVLGLAEVTTDPAYSDPGTVQILPRDIDSQPALDVAQEAATSAGGVVWHTRTGEVRYADADHRRGEDPLLALDACDILVTPTWSRTTSGLINDVSIGYGLAPEGGDGEGGEQPRWLGEAPTSKGRYGTYGFSATTVLAAAGDAAAMGGLLLARNSAPVWIMTDLPVDLKGLSDADTLALLGCDMHSLISLTGLPAAGTAPTSALLWVEGWEETLEWQDHEVEFKVSGYCRTVPAPRWNDVNPATTWDTMGALTWDEATCMGPSPDLGRWDDVPASTRWDLVPAATTWDTWKG